MPVSVQLLSESLGPDGTPDLVPEASDLPDFDDTGFPYLRLVDPYGNTVFSHYQMMSAVLLEFEELAEKRPSPKSAALLELAQRCAREVHMYLWFIGD